MQLLQQVKKLVPEGTITDTEKQVDSITLTYNVSLTKEVSTALTFSVTKSNVQIGDSPDYAGLVNITIDAPLTLKTTTPKTVTVKVTLTEPGDVNVYNAIFW